MRFLALVLLFTACAQSHEITDVVPVHEGAAGGPAVRIAPGSPLSDTWEGGPIDYERWANGTKTPDVGVTVSALTLHSTFSCRNSEGGAQINRSLSSYDPLRCFVMASGSTGPGCNANYWDCSYKSSDKSTTCLRPSAPSTRWKAHSCTSTGCQICGGLSCTAHGSFSWTSNNSTVFVSNGALNGYASQECKLEGGNAVLRRYVN